MQVLIFKLFSQERTLRNQCELTNQSKGFCFPVDSVQHTIDHKKRNGRNHGKGYDDRQKCSKSTEGSNAGGDTVVYQLLVKDKADDQM